MKKISLSLFIFLFFFALMPACISNKTDEQKAREILDEAVMYPAQAFSKCKTFYMKSERLFDLPKMPEWFEEMQGLRYAESDKSFESKTVQELFIQNDKFRVSVFVMNSFLPLEMHFVYDGKDLWTITNFAKKDRQTLSYEEAKVYAGFGNAENSQRFADALKKSNKCKFIGTKIVFGKECDVIETENEPAGQIKTIFYIDKKTKIAIKVEQPDIASVSEVKNVEKIKNKRVPVIQDIVFGKNFAEVVKYTVKVDDVMLPEIFEESSILVPMRNVFQTDRFQKATLKETREMVKKAIIFASGLDYYMRDAAKLALSVKPEVIQETEDISDGQAASGLETEKSAPDQENIAVEEKPEIISGAESEPLKEADKEELEQKEAPASEKISEPPVIDVQPEKQATPAPVIKKETSPAPQKAKPAVKKALPVKEKKPAVSAPKEIKKEKEPVNTEPEIEKPVKQDSEIKTEPSAEVLPAQQSLKEEIKKFLEDKTETKPNVKKKSEKSSLTVDSVTGIKLSPADKDKVFYTEDAILVSEPPFWQKAKTETSSETVKDEVQTSAKTQEKETPSKKTETTNTVDVKKDDQAVLAVPLLDDKEISKKSPQSEIKDKEPAEKQSVNGAASPVAGAAADENIEERAQVQESFGGQYSREDSYNELESELEELKKTDPEEYIRMKKIISDMKKQEEKLKNMNY